ncbi:lysylphosphatidylglycerol synthase transmembrane domain-containing protein [Beggiatoa leptomitoformis]|uniref:Flippase-like domain-containing protein n=1 Tax=Beggiatoa leptomitoformis TaxID=288004 RepID=A0A2N9YBY6_9GAMM|nr:lysylphosphatidylglycerol synthase transmembrane domain-containing protein [Beggiatoa leptomitoformis]ALG66686.1 flippase-like domain-containing protein [Beggiatoa leptomitoformis]AUI67988.1 flippase-like domain-containing protein [Beggiatoa leptomitoformis]
MNKKHKLIIVGTLFSLLLLIFVLARLDWQLFLTALTQLSFNHLLFAILGILCIVLLRAFRWLLIANTGLQQFKAFWQAAAIGFLGNMIYPLRAGEVLRVLAIHHFIGLPFGKALSSSVIDRMLDMMMVGIFMLFVIWLHGSQIDASVGVGAVGVFIICVLILSILLFMADKLLIYAKKWHFQKHWQTRLLHWYSHGLQGIIDFRQAPYALAVVPITLIIFLGDYYILWQIMTAFGWTLPYSAAITVGVFIMLGASLPSAPGYIGIYQVAAILALKLYDIDSSTAVAYSVVLQLIQFAVLGIQGGLVTLYCGFHLSKDPQTVSNH